MARLPRLVIPQQVHHVVQRGIDGQPVFRESDDYVAFLAWLREAARQFKVAVHGYVLLPDGLQLLATPADATGLGRMMQWIGRHYVPYFNRKYSRSGPLWQGRFKAAVIDAERYFIICSRHLELNPVRAGMVTHATDYRWSSCVHHIGVKPDPVVTDHPLYWRLGNTPFEREAVYKVLLEQALTSEEMDEVDASALKGWMLGSEKFKAAMELQTARRVRPSKRGRPYKQ